MSESQLNAAVERRPGQRPGRPGSYDHDAMALGAAVGGLVLFLTAVL